MCEALLGTCLSFDASLLAYKDKAVIISESEHEPVVRRPPTTSKCDTVKPHLFEKVQQSLSYHPVRKQIQDGARSLSLQSYIKEHNTSFNKMFGVIKGKAVPRKSVRTRKLLNSLFEPERPVMRSIASDFCERDTLDLNGESLVHWCCRQDDVVKLQQLIVDNYSLHFRNKKGETPLHVCCFAGSDECCAELLQHTSSDVNCLDNDGWSPLHWAVEQNHLECVKQLLTHKADVNLRLPSGKTPLEIAVQTDPFAKEMMAVLLEQEQTGKVVLKSTGLSKAVQKFEKLALPGDQLHAEETVKYSLAKQLFECADKDGSGSLNKEEFKKALKDLMGMEHLKSKHVTLLNSRSHTRSLPACLPRKRTHASAARTHACAHTLTHTQQSQICRMVF